MIGLYQIGSNPGAEDGGHLSLSHMNWRRKDGCVEGVGVLLEKSK